jgi:hypothetical protein
MCDLGLVANGPLTSVASARGITGRIGRRQSTRHLNFHWKFASKPAHRAIGTREPQLNFDNNFKQIPWYQRSFFLTGRR